MISSYYLEDFEIRNKKAFIYTIIGSIFVIYYLSCKYI